jgi:hypothetical protein
VEVALASRGRQQSFKTVYGFLTIRIPYGSFLLLFFSFFSFSKGQKKKKERDHWSLAVACCHALV